MKLRNIAAIGVALVLASAAGPKSEGGKKPDDRGAVWFVTFLQAPRQDIGWAILKGIGATEEQVRQVGLLYQEYAPKEADLQWRYLEASGEAVKVLTGDDPKDSDLKKIVADARGASLAILRNHLNFWEKTTTILGAKAGDYFKGTIGLMEKTGGSKSYPFYPYLFGPPPEEEGAVLAQKVGIIPDQLEGLQKVVVPLLEAVKPFLEGYTQKLTSLLQMAQAPGTPDWKEVHKITESMVDMEVSLLQKELEFWREFNTFLDEDQVGPFWRELMRTKWEFYIKLTAKKD
jgi:hypothetical protein